MLYKELKPFRFFGVIGLALMTLSAMLGLPLLLTFIETGLVPRFPTAILATGIAQLGFLSVACGLVLESVAQGRREAKRMRYLDLQSVANQS